MIGTTHTMRRLATGLALVATAAALATPTGLAGGKQGYGPPDPWALQYLTASVPFATDTTDSARVAGAQAALPVGFATDTSNSARVAGSQLAGSLPAGFATDTLSSARVARLQPVATVVSGGFAWSSFGIGIGAGIGGLLLVLAAFAARRGRLHRLASA